MIRPGDVLGLALVAEALLIDVVLIRRGHSTISTCARRHYAGRLAVLALAMHLVATVPGDPITKIGGWIEGRSRGPG